MSASEQADRSVRDSARVLLSYAQADATIADELYEAIARKADFRLTAHILGKNVAQIHALPALVEEHDAVVQLISLPFLRSLSCMREVISLMTDDEQRGRYRECTIPIIISEDDDEIDIRHTAGQLQLVEFWTDEAKLLDEGLARQAHVGTVLDEVRAELLVTREVSEQLMRFTRTITDNIYATTYESDITKLTKNVMTHLKQISPIIAAESAGLGTKLAHGRGSIRSEYPPTDAELDAARYRNHLQDLAEAISVASESDPTRPEFPPFSPRFPATPAERVSIPPLDREIWIKDESRNVTGSHKDRMAWEIVVHYKTVLEDLLDGSASEPSIPRASIISNGSAALAIQVMLRCYGLPNLKVLVDRNTDRRILHKLKRAGCDVHVHDLSERELDSEAVLEITENVGGLDFTSRNLVDPSRRKYYDWLAYEILNCGAKHIFVPVGTGDLFVNIMRVLRDELTGVTRDRRLSGGSPSIEALELYGATSVDWKTKMDKLYAAHRPTLDEAKQFVSEMQRDGHCGDASGIYDVGERLLPVALETAHGAQLKCDESGIAGLALLMELDEKARFPAHEELLVVNTGWLALP